MPYASSNHFSGSDKTNYLSPYIATSLKDNESNYPQVQRTS